jgi:arsenite/tail-anchored protein-transporting ATPase
MLVVTLAESTPVHEAERLQTDLRRAGIEPFGWVINASLAAGDTRHPMLRARASSEAEHIEHVQQLSAGGTWLLAWQPEPPIGAAALRQLAADAARSEPALGA